MQDMHRLAGLMKELEDQMIVCMRCGMCQAVCPVFAETGRESDVARGKLALLDGLAREMFSDPRGVQDRLMRCLLCGSCAANCPSGVKVLDIFLKARAILAGYMGMHPLKQALFRGMLSRPELFNRVLQWGSRLQGFFIRPVDELLGTSCARYISPLADRHLRPLAPVPFHRTASHGQLSRTASGLRVAFFVGCIIDKVFPGVGESVLKVMKHHGVGVFVPDSQGCCGIPALSSGDRESFQRLVSHNLHQFASEPYDFLITACATCTSTIRKLWPAFTDGLSPEDQSRLVDMVSKTMDVSQFLVDELGVGPVEPVDGAEVVTYHDPCHLRKSLGLHAQPRTLLKACRNTRLVEMAGSDQCCGCGGSFNLQHYELSKAIGRQKRDSIVQTDCAVVATGCPACMLQMTDMLSQAGDRVRVRHAVEVYAESLG
jgi:glycolate oxidase iron-sulfur subunit